MHIDTTVDQSFGPVGKTMSSSSLRGSSTSNTSMALDGLAASVLIGTVAELIGTVAARGRSVTVSEAIAASCVRSNKLGHDRRRTKYLSSVNQDITTSMKMHC